MSLKIIGAGFGRTGTTSLKLALEQLGFMKCYHMIEVLEHPEHMPMWQAAHDGAAIDWNELFQGYQAAVDWPSCNLWREQMAFFPEAVVILSKRDPDKWYTSVMNTIYPSTCNACESDDPNMRNFGEWAMRLIWERRFDGRMQDKEHVLDVYHQHIQSVIDEVPPEKLLVFDPTDGWEPLCRFLNVDVPQSDYPKSNTTEEFLANEPH